MHASRLPRTQILLFDGFDDLDAVGPLEVLTAAGFEVVMAAPGTPKDVVISAHGLRVAVSPGSNGTQSPAGLIVVPGGGWIDRSAAGVRAEAAGPLPGLLARRHDEGAIIASVCTGAMLLAEAGLLTGRPAITNRGALDDLAGFGADVRAEARVVDDGDVLSAGGVTAGIDLALHLVDRFLGPGASARAAERLEYTPVGPVLVTSGGSD
jgi:putative intracellular protease/amidase